MKRVVVLSGVYPDMRCGVSLHVWNVAVHLAAACIQRVFPRRRAAGAGLPVGEHRQGARNDAN